VVAGDRRDRLKWVDADSVAAYVAGARILRPRQVEPLELDITALPPDEAAAAIREHVEGQNMSRRGSSV
jgi:hypothetical protein